MLVSYMDMNAFLWLLVNDHFELRIGIVSQGIDSTVAAENYAWKLQIFSHYIYKVHESIMDDVGNVTICSPCSQ